MRPRRTRVVAFALLVACSEETAPCLGTGCPSVLTIAFETPPTAPYHVQLVSVTGGVIEFDCANAASCPTAAFHDPQYPVKTMDRVIVIVSNARGSRQFNVTPTYDSHYPGGGERCGLACRNATVTVALP
jgi:hypothetical protein